MKSRSRRLIFSVFFMLVLTGFFLVPAAGQATGPDFEKRMEVSRQIHAIRPVKKQVMNAVDSAAEPLPPLQRGPFQKKLMQAIDVDSIEEASVKAMADIFTIKELEALLAWYGTPEAVSMARKMPVYEDVLMPEITKALDAALLTMRTGSGG